MNLAFNSMKRYIYTYMYNSFRNIHSAKPWVDTFHPLWAGAVFQVQANPPLQSSAFSDKVLHSLTKLFILWQSVALSDTAYNCLIKYYIVWFSVTLSDTALLRQNYRWQRNHSYTLQMFCQRSLWSSRSDYDKASQWNLNTKSRVRSSSTCNASSTFGWSRQLLPHD